MVRHRSTETDVDVVKKDRRKNEDIRHVLPAAKRVIADVEAVRGEFVYRNVFRARCKCVANRPELQWYEPRPVRPRYRTGLSNAVEQSDASRTIGECAERIKLTLAPISFAAASKAG